MDAQQTNNDSAVDLDALSQAFNDHRATSSIVAAWYGAEDSVADVEQAAEQAKAVATETGHGLKLGLGAKALASKAGGIRTDSVMGTQLLRRHMLGARPSALKPSLHAGAKPTHAHVEESRAKAVGAKTASNPAAAPPTKKKRSNKERLAL
jgi:hypothetical protein